MNRREFLWTSAAAVAGEVVMRAGGNKIMAAEKAGKKEAAESVEAANGVIRKYQDKFRAEIPDPFADSRGYELKVAELRRVYNPIEDEGQFKKERKLIEDVLTELRSNPNSGIPADTRIHIYVPSKNLRPSLLFTVGKDIFINRSALLSLPEKQWPLVLAHELSHTKLHHFYIKNIIEGMHEGKEMSSEVFNAAVLELEKQADREAINIVEGVPVPEGEKKKYSEKEYEKFLNQLRLMGGDNKEIDARVRALDEMAKDQLRSTISKN